MTPQRPSDVPVCSSPHSPQLAQPSLACMGDADPGPALSSSSVFKPSPRSGPNSVERLSYRNLRADAKPKPVHTSSGCNGM
ncbi:hypothetical protein CVT26_004905 [Gymnopilus dilepis]|uniref:Uncharacterized protein n=1 Tax=Gymnopilus dilepis TaxID=231916 RepID=A0A409X685_9AGAR|nr:hypothetical protein CVT26_004905 [Gymnopilus dilepis]